MFTLISPLYCKAPTTTPPSTTTTVPTLARQKNETSDIETSTKARIKITPIALPTTSGQMKTIDTETSTQARIKITPIALPTTAGQMMVDSLFPAAVVIGTLSIKSLLPVMSV